MYMSKVHPGWWFLGGLVLGGVGIKCLCSKSARDVYVKTAALGIKAKNGVDTAIDSVKAEYDDIMAEAEYIVACEDAEKEEKELAECSCDTKAGDKEDKKDESEDKDKDSE